MPSPTAGARKDTPARPRSRLAPAYFRMQVLPPPPWDEELVALDGSGRPVFRIRPAATIRDEALSLVDAAGREWCTIHDAGRALQPEMRLTRDGQFLAQIRKLVIGPLSERYEVDVAGGDRLYANGDVRGLEYVIRRGRRVLASVSRAWDSPPDVFGVKVAPNEDVTLLLAATVCLCLMSGLV